MKGYLAILVHVLSANVSTRNNVYFCVGKIII